MKHIITIQDVHDPITKPFVRALSSNVMTNRRTLGRVQKVPISNGVKWKLLEAKTKDKFTWTNPATIPVTLVLRTDLDAYLYFGNVTDAFPAVKLGKFEERYTLSPGQTLNLDYEQNIPNPWTLWGCDIWLDAANWHNYPNLKDLLTGNGPVRMNSSVVCPDANNTYRFEADGPFAPQGFSGYKPSFYGVWEIEVL